MADLYRLQVPGVQNLERMGEKVGEEPDRGRLRAPNPRIFGDSCSARDSPRRRRRRQSPARRFPIWIPWPPRALHNCARVPDIGEVIARSVEEWFADGRNQDLLHRQEKPDSISVLRPTSPGRHPRGPLAGKSIVLTGTLPTLSREAATAEIERHGGRVTSSVSKKPITFSRERIRVPNWIRPGNSGSPSSMNRNSSVSARATRRQRRLPRHLYPKSQPGYFTSFRREAQRKPCGKRQKRFRGGLYGDILSGEEREANAARRACSQPQQKECEIFGLGERLRSPLPGNDPPFLPPRSSVSTAAGLGRPFEA